jgi:hypothetical protein
MMPEIATTVGDLWHHRSRSLPGARGASMARLLRCLLAIAVVSMLAGCASARQPWSAQTETNFLTSCRSSAVAAGSDATSADAACGCTLRGLEAALTEVEFSTLEVQMSQGKTFPDNVARIIGECRVSSSAH